MGSRKVSLDILRIIATLQVLSYHCFIYPLQESTCYELPFFTEILFSLMTSCNVHFILSSSYVASTSIFTFSKKIPIIFTSFFYSIFSFFLSIEFFKNTKFKYKSLLFYLFPIANYVFWYIGPFLLSSMICSMIYPTIQKRAQKFHFVYMLVIYSLYSLQFIGIFNKIGLSAWGYSSFLVISLFACFFKFHEPNIKLSYAFLIFLIMWIHQYYIYCHEPGSLPSFIRVFWVRGLLHPPAILFGIASFIIVIKIDIKTKYDNYFKIFAELSLPIYKLHFHPLNQQLWIEPLTKYQNQLDMYWKYNLIAILKIFIVCGFIEIIHKKISELLLYKREYYNMLIDNLNF